MLGQLRIYNGFGIKPVTSYEAAGTDFFVPDISCNNDPQKAQMLTKAFMKSYDKTEGEIKKLFEKLKKALDIRFAAKPEWVNANIWNILHLMLAVDGSIMRLSQNKVETFLDYYLIINENDGRPGINLRCNDHIFINSGIKVALEKGTAGIFFNKSGKGSKGFDVRACVVDEDYTGYVHLSLAYTKDNAKDGKIFVGDKIVQMVVLPVVRVQDVIQLSEDEYDIATSGSKRGDSMKGSTDNIKTTV